MRQHSVEADESGPLSIAVDCTIAIACRPRLLRTISRPLDSGAYRKARPGSRGDVAPMMPMSDFSGLLSSACALASAAAMAPIDSLDRCMVALHAHGIDGDSSRS